MAHYSAPFLGVTPKPSSATDGPVIFSFRLGLLHLLMKTECFMVHIQLLMVECPRFIIKLPWWNSSCCLKMGQKSHTTPRSAPTFAQGAVLMAFSTWRGRTGKFMWGQNMQGIILRCWEQSENNLQTWYIHIYIYIYYYNLKIMYIFENMLTLNIHVLKPYLLKPQYLRWIFNDIYIIVIKPS